MTKPNLISRPDDHWRQAWADHRAGRGLQSAHVATPRAQTGTKDPGCRTGQTGRQTVIGRQGENQNDQVSRD